MIALVLWLLLGLVATCLEMYGAVRREPEMFRAMAKEAPLHVLALLGVFVLGGPLTLAASLASAFPRRE